MALYTSIRVIVGFIISILILVVLGFYSYQNNQQVIQARDSIYHTTVVLNHIEQSKSNAVKIDELMATFLVTGDSILLSGYTEELKQATIHYTSLKTLTSDNKNQQIRLDSLRSIGRKKLDLHKKIISTGASDQSASLLPELFQQNQQISKRLYDVINGLRLEEEFLLKQRIAMGKVESENFQMTFMALVIVMLIVLVIVFIVVNRALRAKIKAEQNTRLLNKELEAFTYSVSHDLRAPLRSIIGFSQYLKEDFEQTLGAEGIRVLNKVMRNAHQMGTLIDDLLDFARLSRKQLSFSRIDVQLQVNEVIQEMDEHTPGVEKFISVQSLTEMRADLNLMKQVWVNLISNAVKYSRTKETPEIEIGTTSNGNHNAYYVKDNGVGFDMQYYDKLFNVFQRLHSNAEFEGTGVGLALVHKIVTRHKGKIWAEAKPDEGATFYFSIPN